MDIFNEIYKENSYPQAWKKSFVIFIEKPNNGGVRPISLTSSLGKLFESLVKNRLQCYCKYYDILPKSQSGFRKGRSCTDNNLDLILKAEEALQNRKDLLAVVLDVSFAYDNVLSDILLD